MRRGVQKPKKMGEEKFRRMSNCKIENILKEDGILMIMQAQGIRCVVSEADDVRRNTPVVHMVRHNNHTATLLTGRNEGKAKGKIYASNSGRAVRILRVEGQRRRLTR